MPHIFPCTSPNWALFAVLEVLDGGSQMFFDDETLANSLSFRSKGTMCEDSTSFEFLHVHSPTYLPYIRLHIYFHRLKSFKTHFVTTN
jgi:hypothetical protein